MRRPPASVAHVARTHWAVGVVVLASLLPLYWFTRRLPLVEFTARTYLLAGALGGLYLVAGTLVWFGVPWIGPLLSRICALIYLARPNFGSPIWDVMNSEEFKAHFQSSKPN